MYHELQALYGRNMPEIEIVTFSDIPSFRRTKPQWLLDMNPNGKVPAMTHGDVVMFEGGAICSYLLDMFDTERKLLPKNPECVATYYLMTAWCASTLDNLTATSSPVNIVMDRTNTTRPMDDVVINRKYFEEIFCPYFLRQLSERDGPYLCGDQFTANRAPPCRKPLPP